MLRTDLIKRSIAIATCIVITMGTAVPCFAGDDTLYEVQGSFRPDDEDLYLPALDFEYKDNTVTVDVKRDTFVVLSGFRGQIVYDNTQYVSNPISTGTVKFEQFLTIAGKPVKKGEPIAEVSVSTENVDLSGIESQIIRLSENLAEYVATNNELLEEYRYEAEHGSTADERHMAELMYDRLEVSFKNERASREAEIENLSNTYATYSFVEPTQYVVSPCDGVVGYLNRMRKGDTVGSYGFFAIIYGKGPISVVVQGTDGGLRYGQHVEVHQPINGGGEVVVDGIVTTCRSSLLAPNLIGSYDRIELLGDASLLDPNQEVTVRAKSVEMENALIVPNKAVYSDAKGSYVFVYKDQHSVKRYVVTGGSNASETWIVRGLTDGDAVVIK